MKTYTIKTPYTTITRKRRDSAAAVYFNAVYEAIAAQGGLDTAWGHKLSKECAANAENIVSGAYEVFDIVHVLPHGAGVISFTLDY